MVFLSATVFEGGLGCLIARVVPGRDPPYVLGRVAYNAYCEQRNITPPVSSGRTYEALNEAGDPMVADDAAASITASHAARVALDVLDDRTGELGASWLLIGIKAGWLFTHHGHSIALDVGSPPPPAVPECDPVAFNFVEALTKEALDAAKDSR